MSYRWNLLICSLTHIIRLHLLCMPSCFYRKKRKVHGERVLTFKRDFFMLITDKDYFLKILLHLTTLTKPLVHAVQFQINMSKTENFCARQEKKNSFSLLARPFSLLNDFLQNSSYSNNLVTSKSLGSVRSSNLLHHGSSCWIQIPKH